MPLVQPVDLPLDHVVAIEATADRVAVLDPAALRMFDTEGSLVALAPLPASAGRPRALGRRDGVWQVGTDVGVWTWDEIAWSSDARGGVVAFDRGLPVFRHGARWPDHAYGAAVVDAVRFDDGWAVALADRRLLLPDRALTLPAPIADLAVAGGQLRVAALVTAWTVDPDGALTTREIAATSAGPVWGTADGALVGGDGRRIAGVPGAVTASARVGEDFWVGTASGLYRVGADGTERIGDTAGCAGPITGLARDGDALIVGTFDRGACARRDDGQWERLSAPSEMVNAAVVSGGTRWIATASGLVREDATGSRVYGRAPGMAPPSTPGLHHHGANDLAVGPDGTLWVADLFGPVAIRPDGRWERLRLHVSGRSYQAIAACPTGEVWVGGEDDGIAVLGAPLGTRNGRSRWRHVNVADGLPTDWVMALACAGEDAAWVGTYDRGVGRLDRAGYHPVAGLEHGWVQALAVSGDVLWVGTADGLFAVDGGVAERVADLDVHTLLVDRDTLWIGTASGLWRTGPTPARAASGPRASAATP